MTVIFLVLLPRAKRIYLCVTCRACLDVRLNVYMTRNVGLQMEPAAISLEHEHSNSLALASNNGGTLLIETGQLANRARTQKLDLVSRKRARKIP